MIMKGLGSQVEKVWQGLRPMTKKIIVGALQKNQSSSKQSYDIHSDWELSQLLKVLDEQLSKKETKRNKRKLTEIKKIAETCANVLQAQTESAEVFIQLVERALKQKDYQKVEAICQILNERFSAGEVCEIIRQTDNPAIRALAYESLCLFPTASLAQLVDDPLYADIVKNALEVQAFDYESEEAQDILSRIEEG